MAWAYNTGDDTPTKAPMVVGVTLAFLLLSTTILSLRLYVRAHMLRAVGRDDWAIIASWIGIAVYCIGTIIQTKWGLGLQSLEDMPLDNVPNFSLVQFIGAPFYVVGLYGFKMSLLLSYLRFVPSSYRIACWAIMVIITLAHIAFVCLFIFPCQPIRMGWDPSIKEGHCVDQVSFYLSFSSLTILFDVVVMTLPFPVLLQSKIQRRKKLVLLGLFALGVFVTVIQIIRIQTIKSLTNPLDSMYPITWSIVESNVAIVIICVPTLAPLVKYFSERASRSGTGGQAYGGQAYGYSGSGGAGHSKSAATRASRASRYAMQPWRASQRMSGMRPLDSGTDVGLDTALDDVAERGESRAANHHQTLAPVGIVKTTNVVVTRQEKRGDEVLSKSDPFESASDEDDDSNHNAPGKRR